MRFYCHLCDCEFRSQYRLEEHLRESDRHRFDCKSCCLYFDTAFELDRHRNLSNNHNMCYACHPARDFYSPLQLVRHQMVIHNLCERCHKMFDTAEELEDHQVLDYNMCRKCGKYFASAANLKHHFQVHFRKSVACYGCPKTFTSSSAMVLHLEAGSCPSEAGIRTVDSAAHNCYDGDLLLSPDPYFPFLCPECGMTFRFMSGLLQHAESDHFQHHGPYEDFPTFHGFCGSLSHFLDALAEEI